MLHVKTGRRRFAGFPSSGCKHASSKRGSVRVVSPASYGSAEPSIIQILRVKVRLAWRRKARVLTQNLASLFHVGDRLPHFVDLLAKGVALSCYAQVILGSISRYEDTGSHCSLGWLLPRKKFDAESKEGLCDFTELFNSQRLRWLLGRARARSNASIAGFKQCRVGGRPCCFRESAVENLAMFGEDRRHTVQSVNVGQNSCNCAIGDELSSYLFVCIC